jgi:hypothetical protein
MPADFVPHLPCPRRRKRSPFATQIRVSVISLCRWSFVRRRPPYQGGLQGVQPVRRNDTDELDAHRTKDIKQFTS